MSDVNTYGLLLRIENLHGSQYLVAEIVRREGEHDAPRNCSDGLFSESGRPKHLEKFSLSGLAMRGFVSDSRDAALIGYEPCYYNVYSVDERNARRMLATLAHINRRITKDAAYSAVDCFAAFCAALRLSFVVECHDDHKRSSYDDNQWHWQSIGAGRNRYRDLIAGMVAAKVAA